MKTQANRMLDKGQPIQAEEEVPELRVGDRHMLSKGESIRPGFTTTLYMSTLCSDPQLKCSFL